MIDKHVKAYNEALAFDGFAALPSIYRESEKDEYDTVIYVVRHLGFRPFITSVCCNIADYIDDWPEMEDWANPLAIY